MNTGMQDAYNLAWKLSLVNRGVGRDVLLESYDVERSAVGEEVLKRTGILTRAATTRNPIALKLRNLIAPLIANREFFQERARNVAGEVDIAYHSSPLTREHKGLLPSAWHLGGGIGSGARVPDESHLRLSDGRELRLHELLQGTKFHLLLFSGVPPTGGRAGELSSLPGGAQGVPPTGGRAGELASLPGGAIAKLRDIAASLEAWKDHLVTHLVVPAQGPENRHGAVILDQDGTLHQRVGATSECLYLIRPDKYVGLRSKPADLSVLQDYLKSIFVG